MNDRLHDFVTRKQKVVEDGGWSSDDEEDLMEE